MPPLSIDLAPPHGNRLRSFGGIKKRASFEISQARHDQAPVTKYQERARRLSLRGGHNAPCRHACAATSFTSLLENWSFSLEAKKCAYAHLMMTAILRGIGAGGQTFRASLARRRRYQRSMSGLTVARSPQRRELYQNFEQDLQRLQILFETLQQPGSQPLISGRRSFMLLPSNRGEESSSSALLNFHRGKLPVISSSP